MLMNPWHPKLLDYFFIAYTYTGDGLFIIALALILFFAKKRYLSLMIISSYALSGIIAQVLKFFIDEARPAFYPPLKEYAYFIDGVTLHNYHSFPSGHTASVFAFAATVGFEMKNKNYSIVLLLMAALAGYSRIYLGQHFMDDVLAGSVTGLVSAVICKIYLGKPVAKLLSGKVPEK